MALFKLTSDIKPYYPVSLTMEVADLMGTLHEVEQEILVEQVLGAAQYAELHTAYQTNALTAEQTALLAKCQPAVARLALHRFTPEANVNFSSGGLTVTQGEHIGAASEWRTRDVERRLLHSGYRALDVLIGFLNSNQADYPSWTSSAPYLQLNSGIMRRTSEFDTRVRIANSHWFYNSLVPIIRRVEEAQIKPVLCNPNLYTAITFLDITAVVGVYDEVRQYCMNAIAHLVMADAILEMGVGKDERGFYTFSSLATSQTSVGITAASTAMRDTLIKHHQKLGNAALDALKKKLFEHAQIPFVLVEYTASPCYEAQAAALVTPPTSARTDGTGYHAL